MATHKSALKRARQSVKRQHRNKRTKTDIATLVKKFIAAPQAEAGKLLKDVQKKVAKASQKGTLHWKTAARKISRLAKKIKK